VYTINGRIIIICNGYRNTTHSTIASSIAYHKGIGGHLYSECLPRGQTSCLYYGSSSSIVAKCWKRICYHGTIGTGIGRLAYRVYTVNGRILVICNGYRKTTLSGIASSSGHHKGIGRYTDREHGHRGQTSSLCYGSSSSIVAKCWTRICYHGTIGTGIGRLAYRVYTVNGRILVICNGYRKTTLSGIASSIGHHKGIGRYTD